MTNQGININVSGGNAQIGNVQQGDNNTATVGDQTMSAEAARAFADVAAALDEHLAQRPDDRAQIEQLKADLSELNSAFETKRRSRWGTIGEAAKALSETYSWAAPLLKGLVAVLVPGLIL
jgi:hypothetical protein